MSILNIKERFAQRVLKAEEDVKKFKETENSIHAKSLSAIPRSLKETDVGITEYLSDLPGFDAVIKHRYSDFNVHEIDLSGNQAVLNNFDLPDESLSPEALEITLLEEDTLAQLSKLVEPGQSVNSVSVDVTKFSKEERTSIHKFVKAKYGTAVKSNTKDEGELKFIVISRNEKGSKDNRWPGHLPKHLHFILSKTNTDTTKAMTLICSKLKQKTSHFNIAGTKDKRASTSQWVSVKNMRASQLKNIKHLRNIWVGNFVYKDFPLALGSLKGNNFQIALRNVTASDELIETSLNTWKEKGFVNYFGLQRFGSSPEVPTHEIGLQLLKEDYGQAVDLILKPRGDDEKPDIRQARNIWAKTKDPSRALNALREFRSIEGKLLQGLKTHGPKAFVNALDCLPRNVRMLYTHAYQSILWNKVVSRRIKSLGLKVIVGDLVINSEEKPEDEIADINVTTDGDLAAVGVVADVVDEKPCPVKHVTSEDLDQYTIYDVVYPTPGFATVFPKNEVADWYTELLVADGLTLDSLNSRVRQFALPGSYRKLIEKPKNLTWRIVRHAEADEDLILNDFEIFNGRQLKESADGVHRSVVVSLDLESSTYATMALREVLRADTSAAHQTQLKRHADGVPFDVPEKIPRISIEDY